MADLFGIESDAFPKSTTVVGFHGVEAISRLYQFEVFLLVENEHPYFEPDDALGKRATLLIEHPEHPHKIHGQLALLEYIAMLGKHAVFRAVLVPRLWSLTQSLHSRVFTGRSTPQIIETVLHAAGLTSDDYTLKLTEAYAPCEQVCQYRESDFDFVSRWMEREGLYYYFEQDDSSERLVITDDKACHQKRDETVRFVERHGRDVSAGQAITRWASVHTALPASVSLQDYDYQNPTLVLASTAKVSSGSGELMTHNAGFLSEDAGKRAARIRAEELKAGQVVFRAEGTVSGLCAGMQFSLDEHPRGRFNASYFVTGLELRGNQLAAGRPGAAPQPAPLTDEQRELVQLTGLDYDEVYGVTLTAIPAAVQFRAKSVTPWPRIYGYESGITSGASESPYAQIDADGRYKVKLMFDESSASGEEVSAWLRMLQPHGGDSEGFHLPLRAGVEVVVTFLGGDPDRPVIAGFVPNATHPSPVTQSNRTQNVLATGGNNRVVFEDEAGHQSIAVQSPVESTSLRLGWPDDDDDHNLTLSTTGKMSSHTGKDRDVVVGGKLQRTVAGDVTEELCSTLTQTIGSEGEHPAAGVSAAPTLGKTVVTQNVFGNVAQSVNGDVTQKVDGKVSVAFNAKEGDDSEFDGKGDAAYYHTVVGSAFQQATGDWKIKAQKAEMESTDYYLTSNSSHWETVNGNRTEITTLGHQRVIGVDATEIVGGLKNDLVGGAKTDIVVGLKTDVSVLGKLDLAAALMVGAWLGGKVELALGPDVGIKLAKIDIAAFEYVNTPIKLEEVVSLIKNGAIDLTDVEINLLM